jgi:hypothetical protein
MIFTLD